MRDANLQQRLLGLLYVRVRVFPRTRGSLNTDSHHEVSSLVSNRIRVSHVLQMDRRNHADSFQPMGEDRGA